MKEHIRHVALTDEQMPALASLFSRVFKRPFDPEDLRHKYDTSFLGIGGLARMAVDGDQPIASTGILPQRFTSNNQQLLGAQVCDLAALPEVRGTGLHERLLAEALNIARERGVDFFFTLPNDQAHRALDRHGFSWLPRMRGFKIPVATVPLGRLARRIPLLHRLHLSIASKILNQSRVSDGIRNSHAANGALCVDYSRSYLHSKRRRPSAVINAGGAAAWVAADSALEIGDLDSTGIDDLAPALGTLMRMARNIGCSSLLFQCTVKTKLERALSHQFTGFDSWPVGVLRCRPDVTVEDLRLNFGDLDTF